MTVLELAREAGVGRSTIHRLELSETLPRRAQLHQIARVLKSGASDQGPTEKKTRRRQASAVQA